MIRGIGSDIVEKERVEHLFTKYGYRFVNKLLCSNEKIELNERMNLDKKISYLSNNFASKEATSKALGTGFTQGITLKNIEITRNDSGAPCLTLTGKAEQKAEELGLENFFLSISDTSNLSSAIVVGEGS